MMLNHIVYSCVEILSNPKMKFREKTKFKIIEEIPIEELKSMAQANKDGLYSNLKIGHKNVMLIFFQRFLGTRIDYSRMAFQITNYHAA